MIRDITIGQYYPAKSVLHRLDPRTKFLGTLGFLISVFLFHTFLGYAVATAFLVAMIAISKVPVKFMFKGLKAIVMILLITVVFNIILTPGEVLWRFGIIKVTREGLVLAGRMAIRLVYLVIGSSITEWIVPEISAAAPPQYHASHFFCCGYLPWTVGSHDTRLPALLPSFPVPRSHDDAQEDCCCS